MLLLMAYLVGGIPFAVLVVRLLRGVDVRSAGTGNVGARNSLRVGGPLAGLLVLSLDIIKSASMILLARALDAEPWTAPLAGVMAVLGHCYSPYMIATALRQPWPGWRKIPVLVGGMGLATGFGMVLVLTPLPAAPIVIVGVLILVFIKHSTLAGSVMAILSPIGAALVGYPLPILVSISLGSAIVLSKHLADQLVTSADDAQKTSPQP